VRGSRPYSFARRSAGLIAVATCPPQRAIEAWFPSKCDEAATGRSSQFEPPGITAATFPNEARPAPIREAPIREWGPASLPAPTAPSEGSAGVLEPGSKNPKAPKPALDPGSPAQASLSIEQFPRERSRSTYLTARPEGSLVFRSSGLALDPRSFRTQTPRRKPPDVPRPFLGKPLLRPASLTRSPTPTRRIGTREPRRARNNLLFRRPLPGWPRNEPESPSQLPAGGDRFFCPFLARCAVAGGPGETGTSAPITLAPCTSPPSRKSEKYRLKPVDNGDIGHKGGTFPQRLKSARFGCRFVPPGLPPNRA
jgi:hypothetical protein